MTKQETTVMKKPQTGLAVPEALKGRWSEETIDAADILIPKILLMQAMSDLVAQEKAAVGDLVKSTTGEILGGKSKSFEFIPIMMFKTWVIEEKIGDKFEFRGVEELNSTNVDDEIEWPENGTTWRKNKCLNFYILLPQDIQKERAALQIAESGDLPDPDDALLPAVLSFRRTGYSAGKTLATHWGKAASFNVSPAVNTFKMRSFMEKNDKGTYYVPLVEKSGKTSLEDLGTCKKWHDTLTKTKVKVDNSDLEA